MTASNHEAIAKHVWPDTVFDPFIFGGKCYKRINKLDCKVFDLLETDINGNPTQQAKASALDVLVWLSELTDGCILIDVGKCESLACESIYKTACEVLGLEVANDKTRN